MHGVIDQVADLVGSAIESSTAVSALAGEADDEDVSDLLCLLDQVWETSTC